MRPCKRWFYLVSRLVVAFVAVSSIVAAISAGSWSPVVSVGWLPAVSVRVLARCRPPLLAGAQRPHRVAMKNLVRALRTERNLAQGHLAPAGHGPGRLAGCRIAGSPVPGPGRRAWIS
jgi:hypothetical protein